MKPVLSPPAVNRMGPAISRLMSVTAALASASPRQRRPRPLEVERVRPPSAPACGCCAGAAGRAAPVSSALTRRLTEDLGSPSARAAAVKLPVSITRTNALT